jgi:undecaprenyl diphosphate synthase
MPDKKGIPCHIAIVMDGNGRWAERQGLPRLSGHNAGMKAMKEIIKRSSELGVKYLTVYAFSTENWKRPAKEVSGIFKLLVFYVDNELKELHENNVKVQILGEYNGLPDTAVGRINKAIKTTEGNDGLVFNIALNYGSRAEITSAVKRIALKVKNGELNICEIDEETVNDNLYTGGDFAYTPDPDLVIRTGGEMRVSNYLLWQCANSEFVFTDVLWPDFTPEKFEKAISEYQKRERRFGGR